MAFRYLVSGLLILAGLSMSIVYTEENNMTEELLVKIIHSFATAVVLFLFFMFLWSVFN